MSILRLSFPSLDNSGRMSFHREAEVSLPENWLILDAILDTTQDKVYRMAASVLDRSSNLRTMQVLVVLDWYTGLAVRVETDIIYVSFVSLVGRRF